MEGGLRVICREIVKPSSPTPHHLKWLKLSYLDQLCSNVYLSLVFFYQTNESESLTTAQISERMKQSLSNALTSFYPLAGRLDADNLVVDCNDAGVEFVEAQVQARLMDVIEDPDLDDLKKYVPFDPVGPGERPLFNVQITFFDCGGISLGVYFSHIITDCHSVVTFLNAWAAICRGEPKIPRPVSFDLANYLPAKKDMPILSEGISEKKSEKCCYKRFVFTREIVAYLKQYVVFSSGSRLKDPTRVEVISTFIWKIFLKAALKSSKTYAARHAVNLRGRNSLSRSLDNAFGNYAITTAAFADTNTIGSQVEELHELVSKVRSSIRRIDGNYITRLQSTGNNIYLNDLFEMLSLYKKEELEWLIFRSWCRFPVYEMEYGFGSPIWYCPVSSPMNNNIILTSNKSEDIIEAWVCVEEHNLQLIAVEFKLISDAAKDI